MLQRWSLPTSFAQLYKTAFRLNPEPHGGGLSVGTAALYRFVFKPHSPFGVTCLGTAAGSEGGGRPIHFMDDVGKDRCYAALLSKLGLGT